MRSAHGTFKQEAIRLRIKGKTYGEIIKILQRNIPKSTLSLWLKDVVLTDRQTNKIIKSRENKIHRGRLIALKVNRIKRRKYLSSVINRIKHLRSIVRNKDVAKIGLAMLYLGEGSKTKKGSLTFGNSDPATVTLFLRWLRYCYDIQENKFRCTLQCRSDQPIKDLEVFWSRTTKIPLRLFYKARIDPRSLGKSSLKLNYKGVCRIDYFSADIFNEIMSIIDIIKTGR